MAISLALTLREARKRTGLSAYGAAWVGLAVAALLALFPLRFTAVRTVEFAVGTQPPALLVRGMEQLIASRALAYDALQKLDYEEVARLSAGGAAAVPGSERDVRSASARAAWRLMDDLEVRPFNGGRALEISVSAPTAALSARVADAYVAALMDLQTAAQARLPGSERSQDLLGENAADGLALPALRPGPTARMPALPDPPRPLALGLLVMAGLILLLARRWPKPISEAGPVDGSVLPIELSGHPKVEWLDGGEEAGLVQDDAVERLAALLEAPTGLGQVVLLTSDDLPGASAGCAVDLARALAEEARVALVALDGNAGELSALTSDPRAPGVSELLFGVAGFGETIHRDPHSRAHVIPPGRDARGGPGMVGAERLVLVLGALRQTYDFVVVAAPSLAGSRKAARLVELDPLLVCIHADTTPATAAVESFDALVARRFPRVVMLCLSTTPAEGETDGEAVPVRIAPSMEAIAEPDDILARPYAPKPNRHLASQDAPEAIDDPAPPKRASAKRATSKKAPAEPAAHITARDSRDTESGPRQGELPLDEQEEQEVRRPRRRRRPPLAGAA